MGDCRGLVQMEVRNLMVLYQDFRIGLTRQTTINDNYESELTCGNEKEAINIQYLKYNLLGAKPWQNVVTITIRQLWQLELVLKAIPTSRFGTICTLYDFPCRDTLVYTKSGLERYKLCRDCLELVTSG